jgi:hypothetical protein
MNMLLFVAVYNKEPILDGLGLQPTFADPLANVTVAIGREVTLTCPVENLGTYKVKKRSLNKFFLHSLPDIRSRARTAFYRFHLLLTK